MIRSEPNNILSLDDFYNRYYNEWKSGTITEQSVDDLFELLTDLDVDIIQYRKINYTIECLVSYLIKYRFRKNQSVSWIEPIRNNSWELYSWANVDPDIIIEDEYKKYIPDYIHFSLSKIFRRENIDKYKEIEENIVKEFTIENLSNINFIEDYLQKYARSDKIRKYLQIKGIYYGRRFVI